MSEGGHGFVEHQQARLEGEGAGDVDALALPARELVRVAGAELLRRQAHALEQRAGPGPRRSLREAVHLRSVGDGIDDGQARVERGEGILEHHLQGAPVVLHRQAAGAADGFAVEDELAGIGIEQAGDQARGGRFAAARFADHAERLALGEVEAHVVDGVHLLLRRQHAAAAHREALAQVAHAQQRLGRAATVGQRRERCVDAVVRAHLRKSIAERTPSASRLKAIEVTKIIAPGRAATQGLT